MDNSKQQGVTPQLFIDVFGMGVWPCAWDFSSMKAFFRIIVGINPGGYDTRPVPYIIGYMIWVCVHVYVCMCACVYHY